MRMKHPAGEFVCHPDHQHLLVPRTIEDSGPFYKVFPEGYIEGFNGWNIPFAHTLSDNDSDFNRSFPYDWRSNRDGAGAKITIHPPLSQMMMYAECRLGGSYASSSDKRLFFGLGAATKVDKITIKWPSGAVQTHQLTEVDKRYSITEGGACTPENPL